MIYHDITRFSEYDIYLFKKGDHYKLYDKFGSFIMERNAEKGVYFSVWAPHAKKISVVGDFNSYQTGIHPLKKREDGSGIWEGFITEAKEMQTYKYAVTTPYGKCLYKTDPYAKFCETPPRSASVIYDIQTALKNKKTIKRKQFINDPVSIYEVHLLSWKKEYNNYKELAYALINYVKKMNFTHIEILPIAEFPFEGSWGYQVCNYFAPTSRLGTPKDFLEFVNIIHKEGIYVIMDWVPSHFVTDGHCLSAFDGEALYEYKDPKLGYHPEWKSAVFDYGRNEVKSFLISSAFFWFDKYGIDAIRVDGVASMLYRDYARKNGEWIPNVHGENHNLEAIKFLQDLNIALYQNFEGICTIAEESTAFPKVTYPVYEGGLGFGYKWNMGWMNDTLEYFKKEPVYRKHHHHQLTFSFSYAFSENYILPLSHDEVVHMKGSLINKMPGDINQKFANLRALYAYMYAHPGKKLLFMGNEIAQFKEWNYKQSLEWNILQYPNHTGIKLLIQDLNRLYSENGAMHMYDTLPKGFEWLEANEYEKNILAFYRKSDNQTILIVCNFADTVYEYRLGVTVPGNYTEIFCSQDKKYNGWEIQKEKTLKTDKINSHGKEYSILLKLPALGVIYYELN